MATPRIPDPADDPEKGLARLKGKIQELIDQAIADGYLSEDVSASLVITGKVQLCACLKPTCAICQK